MTAETKISSSDWNIKINQVNVGSISDADYALIRQTVFTDVRTYISQALNVTKFFLNVITYVSIRIPVLWFWFFLGVAVFTPETFEGDYRASAIIARLNDDFASDVAADGTFNCRVGNGPEGRCKLVVPTGMKLIAPQDPITRQDVRDIAVMLCRISAYAALLFVFVVIAFCSNEFGLTNRFQEAIDNAVRRHCGVAAEGQINLSRARRTV
ncbi:hypothetical protein NO430_21910 (plasmid) [Xanthomonas oryzae pv. oryzae]|uniref:hypothetical protein n=1 Tax=Xanthomonas oryzae TaxID=347 RepID=UPI00217EEC62|nr:hypothetical protein [Xanthomonas oryzae]UWI58942.1 hypothetical protein NO430_21910 [Xanthomonas oryzae pv. oryzae]